MAVLDQETEYGERPRLDRNWTPVLTELTETGIQVELVEVVGCLAHHGSLRLSVSS
ncbi:hypothetical protein ACN27G_15375 [Plantactinospora sp. WMMB334]|uniref:hypothetical protein n=1 Tax=Plantactinospora sp. WMMB334 TaxID=3404119 RepID=UPI003B93DB3B